MTRIVLLVLMTTLLAGCQRREHRELSQASGTTTQTKDTTRTVSSPPDTIRTVSGTGMILHVDLEGGFYGLVDDVGERYDPSNMPEDFKVDSLRVRYQATLTNKVNAHMWGKPVDIIILERLD
jgi:hypothetical protein